MAHAPNIPDMIMRGRASFAMLSYPTVVRVNCKGWKRHLPAEETVDACVSYKGSLSHVLSVRDAYRPFLT